MKKELRIQYDYFTNIVELEEENQYLIAKAREVAKKAYAPYSKFYVGASLVLENGEVILGSNQENIAFPSGLCAERVALFYAGSNYPNLAISKLVVVANGDLIAKEAVLSPCGSCRQVLLESQNRQEKMFPIYLVGQDDSVHIFSSIYDLMPMAFGK